MNLLLKLKNSTNLCFYLFQKNNLVWISHPGIENPASMRWSMLQVVINSSRTHFLRETYNIRFNAKMLVTPHLACGSASSLHLVHHQGHIPLPRDLLQALKKLWTGVVVSTLSLDWLGDDACHRCSILALNIKDQLLFDMVTYTFDFPALRLMIRLRILELVTGSR